MVLTLEHALKYHVTILGNKRYFEMFKGKEI